MQLAKPAVRAISLRFWRENGDSDRKGRYGCRAGAGHAGRFMAKWNVAIAEDNEEMLNMIDEGLRHEG